MRAPLARYAFQLTPHACSPDVLLEGYKPETIGLLGHIGIDKVSRLLILRYNIIYGMWQWQMGAVTDEFADAKKVFDAGKWTISSHFL